MVSSTLDLQIHFNQIIKWTPSEVLQGGLDWVLVLFSRLSLLRQGALDSSLLLEGSAALQEERNGLGQAAVQRPSAVRSWEGAGPGQGGWGLVTGGWRTPSGS